MATFSIADEAAAVEGRRRLYTGIIFIVAGAALIAGYRQAESMNSGGFVEGLSKFLDYPGEIVMEAVDTGAGMLALLWGFLPALVETLNIAIVATIVGAVLATGLSFLASRNLEVWPPLVPAVRRVMDLLRAFPELIVALFLIYVLGTSPVPAMIAVAFHTVGALGKLFSEVNENVDMRPWEGLKACGASWGQRVRFAILPQVLPNYVSYLLLRLEINVRASAILGFVGAGGIGAELRRTIGWGKGSGDETAALFILLFLSIVAIDRMSAAIRGRLAGAGLRS